MHHEEAASDCEAAIQRSHFLSTFPIVGHRSHLLIGYFLEWNKYEYVGTNCNGVMAHFRIFFFFFFCIAYGKWRMCLVWWRCCLEASLDASLFPPGHQISPKLTFYHFQTHKNNRILFEIHHNGILYKMSKQKVSLEYKVQNFLIFVRLCHVVVFEINVETIT